MLSRKTTIRRFTCHTPIPFLMLLFSLAVIQLECKASTVGTVMTLKAVNGQYVSADNDGHILVANSAYVDDFEKFEIVDAGNGQVGLKCVGNGKYVSAEDAGNQALVANRSVIGPWEKFTIVNQSQSIIGLQASINNRFVAAEKAGEESLIANRGALGPWEAFTWGSAKEAALGNDGVVKVFILAGQSNMQGHGFMVPSAGHIDKNRGMGTLEYLVNDPNQSPSYKHLVADSGAWAERDDVWIDYLNRAGALSVGYGAESNRFGPELQFGHVVGESINNPVLIIKTAWGGKSLFEDFRPPSSGGSVGPYYTKMVEQVYSVLGNIASHIPGYHGQGYELAGIGWHQGWNDRLNNVAVDTYQTNLVNLINDLREEFQKPDLPFVIASTGMAGWSESDPIALALMQAQLAVPQDNRLDSAHVVAIDTRRFWHDPANSPSDFTHHWNHNGETYLEIGESMGRAMLELLSYSSSNDNESQIISAMKAINDHIKGISNLSTSEIAAQKERIEANIDMIGYSSNTINAAFNLVTSYENIIGPLFINKETTVLDGWGWDRRTFTPNIHTTVLSVMQGIIDFAYTSETITKYKNLLNGYRFQSSDYFPGKVTSIPDPYEVHTATINGSYLKTFGHLIMHADKPAVKPTGTYLAPGSIATVMVPLSMVGKGYRIRVGAHAYDLSNKPFVKRLDRSSIVYEINNIAMNIASPLGGGIYIEVPYLADAGLVDVSIQNAVRAPFFSKKSFHSTTLAEWRNTERKYGAPWADFQTEKFMMQVPTSWINNYDDPSKALADWDNALDAVSDLMGYPHVRGKESLYVQVDVIIKSGAYSPGYPQVNNTYNPRQSYNGNVNHFFLTGPRSFADIEFHELGHGHLFQKFPGETEAAVNLLYVPVLNRAFGMSLDEAFAKSLGETFSFNTLSNTAITWMASENFKLEKPMVSQEMQYQHKGHAKYVEVAKLFGWNVLGDYWQSINQVYEEQTDPSNATPGHVKNIDASIDGLISRMSQKAGVDLKPLMHFWGAHPSDASSDFPPSVKIYDQLVRYKNMVPLDNQAFRVFVERWWKRQPKADGYITEAYHAGLWNSWDAAYATSIKQNVQNIIDRYFPDGRPGTPSGPVVIPGEYQAENATAQKNSTFSKSSSGYTGQGFMDYGGKGAWIEWNNVEVSAAGNYQLILRYAVGSEVSRKSAVIVNGKRRGTVNFTNTGGWTKWKKGRLTVTLRKGKNTIRVKAITNSGGPNLDVMKVR